jgi:serine/threonine protein kinase
VENVLLGLNGHVTLIDLGLAAKLDERPSLLLSDCVMAHESGSLIYMAPEMLCRGVAGRHSDWWAFGVLAHELLTGRTPWSSLTDKDVIVEEIKTLDVPPPPLLSEPARSLLFSLLQKDYTLRLGTTSNEQIRSCSFFQSIDWGAVERRETPAAFIPGPNCYNHEDREVALTDYMSRSAKTSAADPHPWFLGLDVVTSHPGVDEENDENGSDQSDQSDDDNFI